MKIPGSTWSERIALTLSLAAGLAACAGSSSTHTADGTLDGPDVPLALSATEVISVGALEGADWETFSSVDAVAFDGAGNLYIFDPDNYRVVVADPEGRHLRTLGREGDGPGELRQPVAMAVGRDGTVVVADVSARALVVYSDSGAFERQVAYEGPGMPLSNMAMRTTGDLLTRGRGMVVQVGPEGVPEEPDFMPIRAISPVDGSETVLYEAWLPPEPEAIEPETLEGENARVTIVGPRLEAFRPEVHAAALPDGGLAVADSVDWSIHILAPDGTPLDVLRRPIQSQPVTDALREAERARRIAAVDEGGARVGFLGGGLSSGLADQFREMQRRRIEDMVFADVVPVIARVVADWEGRLWVERTGEQPGEEGPVDLVGADGAYFGTLAPGSLPIPSAFGPDGLAAFVETDELDVQHVVVRRIDWPPEGSLPR